jgi:PAS domain S-box-containing protein
VTKESELKEQRDRFLAFSFAGADFLLETDVSGNIIFTSGASKSLTGQEDQELIRKNFLELFSKEDRALLSTLQKNSRPGIKQGPYMVSMAGGSASKVFVTGFTMPGNSSFYAVISRGDNLFRLMGFEKDGAIKHAIANKNEFMDVLNKKIPNMIAEGKDADLMLVELQGIADYKRSLDQGTWSKFMESIGDAVMASSVDGDMAASVKEGQYVIVKDKDASASNLHEKLQDIARNFNLSDLDIKSKTVEGDLPDLTEREATRAILYTMNQMEKQGIEKSGDDLKKSFQMFLEENTIKIKSLKNLISHQRFTINFQPIVDMSSRDTSHFEVLVRFEDNVSPYDLIVLGEDVGIAPDVDMSVCRQALKFADQKKNRTEKFRKLAINLSGVSVQNEAFKNNLLSLLKEYPDAAKHLSFEITESTMIKDLDEVNEFIQKLRRAGHSVCLDDFGAGASSFQYLHKLDVDGIKIDGAYTKKILESPRDATMIKNLTQMCHELDVFVVAEMVETEAQAKYLRDIGIDKGQGWLFGKPAPTL